MEWNPSPQNQDGLHLGGMAGEATLPLTAAFPSPADYAALLHHDPAHTSQQVRPLMPQAEVPLQ